MNKTPDEEIKEIDFLLRCIEINPYGLSAIAPYARQEFKELRHKHECEYKQYLLNRRKALKDE